MVTRYGSIFWDFSSTFIISFLWVMKVMMALKKPGHLKLFQAKVRMKMIRLVVLGISKLIHVC